MARKIMIAVVSIILFLLLFVFSERAYFFISFLIIGLIMLPFFIRFEKRSISAREVVLLAVFIAVAAVSRIPFAALPSIQPTSFIMIMVGIGFGAETGFIVGAVSALVSNLVLGQGPWTPWQMFAWGLMGMTAGMMSHYLQQRWQRLLFGFIWGFLFGWTMNLWVLTTQIDNLTLELIIGIYTASFVHDFSHALSNVVLLFVFSSSFLMIFKRLKRKYGVLVNK